MTDLDPELRLDRFPNVAFSQWRAAAEKLLGAPLEAAANVVDGIAIAPLRADDDRPAGSRPLWTRGGWAVAQEIQARDPAALASALREGGDAGLQLAWVALSGSARAGCRTAVASAGLAAMQPDELRWIVEAARDTGVSVLVHADATALALLEAWREVAPDLAGLAGVVADPLAGLAELGARGSTLGRAYERIAKTTRAAIECGGDTATILASGVPYHDAGAGPAAELGAAIAAGLSHLRGLAEHGITPALAAPRIGLRFALGRDVFVAIAKLRAARCLWSAALRRLGVDDAPVRIWARTSWRSTTRLDLPVNLVRHTLQAFAAAVGGVEHLCVQPHTEACGPADADARRWARNVQHLLRGEAQLHRVADPAAGSAFVEHLTRQLAQRAWPIVQALATADPEGALAAALRDGNPKLSRAGAEAMPLVGVELHPDPKAPAPVIVEPSIEEPELAKPLVSLAPLRRGRLAARFETARERMAVLREALPADARVLAIGTGLGRESQEKARRLGAWLGLPVRTTDDLAGVAFAVVADADAARLVRDVGARVVLVVDASRGEADGELAAIVAAGGDGLAMLCKKLEAAS